MQSKRIKIKSQITGWQLILFCIIAFAIAGGLLYLVFTQDVSYSSRSETSGLIIFIFFVIPTLFKQVMSKEEYLSDIYITEHEIKLVYKIRNKISKTEIVQKNNIKSFDFDANINVVSGGKYTQTAVAYRFFIDLIEGNDLYEINTSGLTLVEGNYKFVYRILSAANDIPNFNFNLDTNNDFIKAEIDYFRRFGKPIPSSTKFKMGMNTMPLWLKVIIILPLLTALFFIGMYIYLFIPADIGLSSTEKEYIRLVDNSYNYKDNYNKALYELDKAKNLVSTDPYLYYRYAYIYEEKIKDYDRAIEYAKKGISNLGNPEIYNKRYKSTRNNTDVYLYDVLGDCYRKLGEWGKAIEAYTYVANSDKNWKYSNVYFTRGRMYFKLEKYNEAKQDFLKHRDVIIDYMNTYPEDSNNKRYDNDDLTNINKWINACNI